MDSVRISRSDDGITVSIVAEGPYTLDEVKAAIGAAAADSPSGRDCCLLMDIRRSEATPTKDELQDFAEFLGMLPVRVAARAAWLVSADLRFGLARMLSVFAEEQNITIKVFRDADAAREWLHAEHEAGHK